MKVFFVEHIFHMSKVYGKILKFFNHKCIVFKLKFLLLLCLLHWAFDNYLHQIGSVQAITEPVLRVPKILLPYSKASIIIDQAWKKVYISIPACLMDVYFTPCTNESFDADQFFPNYSRVFHYTLC